MGLERCRFFPGQLGTKNAIMQLFYQIQQFRACAGADKRTAGPATGFRKPRMSTAKASSKCSKITRRFGSTGSSHGIPPNLEGIMTQKVTIRNEINSRGEDDGRIPAENCWGNHSVFRRALRRKALRLPPEYRSICPMQAPICRQKTLQRWQLKPLICWGWIQ
jgi:hypothetical protein